MFHYPEKYQVIVIGGGHAGVEAACAAARMGCRTLLVTHSIDTVGVMSCNPAIGGLGKTHLVKEVDALDGLMGKAADQASIHKRVLNTSKGAAVQAVRFQACRDAYRRSIRQLVEQTENLFLFQAEVSDLWVEDDRVMGVDTKSDIRISGESVVLTTGTFLAGKIHIGQYATSGGRAGDPASEMLATYLGKRFKIGHLKTGTPPRIAEDSIDFSELEIQASDTSARSMSYIPPTIQLPQKHCYITHTNAASHEIIRRYVSESPIFQKKDELLGPRYCPSIEQKVDRFPDKDSHQIFIEPEGLHAREIYPNGISTSLPFHAQVAFIRSIKGFEKANITRAGYAISYGYFDPRNLRPTLETKLINRLFFAGQINGTTGYEEAAAQGLMAGINAAAQVLDKPPLVLSRSQGYIGVLIDDLVTNGTIEPYRMFTSRAEFRLQLRCDNAHHRLTEIGSEVGVVKSKRLQHFLIEKTKKLDALAKLSSEMIKPGSTLSKYFPDSLHQSLAEAYKRPEIPLENLIKSCVISEQELEVYSDAVTEIRYAGYIAKQASQIKRLQAAHETQIPSGFVYESVKGLSAEILEKLNFVKPATLGQASRISGVTPAALSLLSVYLKQHASRATSE